MCEQQVYGNNMCSLDLFEYSSCK